jgi:hypothetical protein
MRLAGSLATRFFCGAMAAVAVAHSMLVIAYHFMAEPTPERSTSGYADQLVSGRGDSHPRPSQNRT